MRHASTATDLPDRLVAAQARLPSGARQFVAFTLGDNAYGIDIMAVREIRSWSPITTLPQQGHGARGVLDIRGTIVEVFDLSTLLGVASGDAMANQVVLVVAIGPRDVGLAVDSVSDIVDAADGDFAEPPSAGGKTSTIVRKDGQLIAILDLHALFA